MEENRAAADKSFAMRRILSSSAVLFFSISISLLLSIIVIIVAAKKNDLHSLNEYGLAQAIANLIAMGSWQSLKNDVLMGRLSHRTIVIFLASRLIVPAIFFIGMIVYAIYFSHDILIFIGVVFWRFGDGINDLEWAIMQRRGDFYSIFRAAALRFAIAVTVLFLFIVTTGAVEPAVLLTGATLFFVSVGLSQELRSRRVATTIFRRCTPWLVCRLLGRRLFISLSSIMLGGYPSLQRVAVAYAYDARSLSYFIVAMQFAIPLTLLHTATTQMALPYFAASLRQRNIGPLLLKLSSYFCAWCVLVSICILIWLSVGEAMIAILFNDSVTSAFYTGLSILISTPPLYLAILITSLLIPLNLKVEILLASTIFVAVGLAVIIAGPFSLAGNLAFSTILASVSQIVILITAFRRRSFLAAPC